MMRALKILLFASALLVASNLSAFAQSACQYIAYGAVLTAAQWNSCFQNKQDVLAGTPVLVTGGVMTGELVIAASTTNNAGINLQPGAAPSAPNNGDLWTTASGLFVQINGATIELTGAGSGSFTATSPLAVTFPSAGVVNYALNYNSSLAVSGGNLGINLANGNIFSVAQAIDLGTGTEPAANTGAAWEAYGANGAAIRDEITAFNNSVSGAVAIFDGRTSLGTRASPSTVVSATMLVSFEGKGYDGSVWTGTGAAYHVYAEGTWTTSSHPGEGCVATTQSGATTTTDQLCIHNDGGVTIGSPTGGDKGAGTLNIASSLYLNGTAAAISINSTNCLLGGSCSITASSVSITPGTTTISGATAPCVIENTTGTTMGCSTLTNSYLASGSFTNITGVGTLTAGATGSGFTIALGTSTITGTLGVGNGGIGLGTLTSNAVYKGNGTSPIAVSSISDNGTAVAVTSEGFGLSGNISASAWTTNGIRYVNAPATLTDTSSSGTVAAAYTDNWGGSTIAASHSVTYTAYYGSYFHNPVAGTDVTFTAVYAIGADSLYVNGATAFFGAITVKVRTATSTSDNISATTDYFVCADNSSAGATENLPSSPANGLTFLIKDCGGNAATHNITVSPASGNIDGSSTYVMTTNYQSIGVTYSGSQWSVN